MMIVLRFVEIARKRDLWSLDDIIKITKVLRRSVKELRRELSTLDSH